MVATCSTHPCGRRTGGFWDLITTYLAPGAAVPSHTYGVLACGLYKESDLGDCYCKDPKKSAAADKKEEAAKKTAGGDKAEAEDEDAAGSNGIKCWTMVNPWGERDMNGRLRDDVNDGIFK